MIRALLERMAATGRSVRAALSGWQARWQPVRRVENGFSLVELLVVLVILPLIIGAVAGAIIVSLDNNAQVAARLSDSTNAQITSAYLVRDIQGASFATTPPVGVTLSPPLCGPASSGSTPLLGLYRPTGTATPPTAPFSVGYWETSGTTPEIVRYSCTLGSSAPNSQVVISDDISTAAQAQAVIEPQPFSTLASAGWAPTSATTTVTAATTLPNGTIPASSTSGFNVSDPLIISASVNGSTGPFLNENVVCTGSSSTSFTGCSGGSGTAEQGAAITQPTGISAIHLLVDEPQSAYVYGLQGSPRALSSYSSGNGSSGPPGGPPNGGPALLTLGTGVSIQGGKNATLTVNGIVDVSQGTLSCTGNPNVTATGYEATGGSGAIGSCATGGSTTTLASPTPDPLAPYLPNPFPTQPLSASCSTVSGAVVCAASGTGICQPGEWVDPLPSGCSLEPGVYVLDQGYAANGGSLQMAAGAPAGQGVLLYLPCTASSCSASINMGGNSTLSLPPLTASQSYQYFSTSPYPTALAGVVVWQNVGDTQPDAIGGTPLSISPGTLYLPGAAVTLQGNAGSAYGQIIAASITIAGSTPLTVTGQ